VAILYILRCTSYRSIHSWDITISGLKKQTPAILEFYFQFRLRPYHGIRHVILDQAVEFYPNRTIFDDVISIFKVGTLRRNFTSGFELADFPVFKRSMSISKPNFLVIAQSTSDLHFAGLEKQTSTILDFYFQFRFWPNHRTRHVTSALGCRLPNFVQSVHPQRRWHRFLRWQPLQRNFTSGFGFGDVAVFRVFVSISKPNFIVIAQSTAEIQLFQFSKKQASAILEFYFRFRFRPYHGCQHDILYQSGKFHPNRTACDGKITSCRFSR